MLNIAYMRLLIHAGLFTMNTCLQAQLMVEESLQLYLLEDGRQYGVVPIADKGLVVFNEIKNYSSSASRRWEITQLDTLLVAQSKSYFESEYSFQITHVKYHKDFIYLLFQDLSIPIKSAFFVRGNVIDNKFEIFALKDFLPDKIVELEILGNSMFLIGPKDRRPSVLKYKYGDPRPQVLKGLSAEKTELLHTSRVPGFNLIQIVTRMRKIRGGIGMLMIKQFDENGDIHKDIVIESARGRNLLNCTASTDFMGNICIVGTYSYGNSKMSDGIFSLVHDGTINPSAYYYEYGNLYNFFNYLPTKERDKLEKKYGLEYNDAKKSKYKINQMPREIVRTDNGWVYLGEMIEYSAKNSREYGNMWFKEFNNYSHALLLGISEDGKLKWDNSISLNNLATDSEIQQTNFTILKDHIIAFYQQDAKIFYEVIRDSQQIDTYGNLNLLESKRLEHTRNKVQGNILPWYQNKYIAFGTFYSLQNDHTSNKYFYLGKIAVSSKNISNSF